MPQRKLFKAASPNLASFEGRHDQPALLCPSDKTRIDFEWTSGSNLRGFDFAPLLGKGCDEIVLASQRAVESIIESRKLRTATIANHCSVGLRHFLNFCAATAQRLQRPLILDDVRLPLIEEYIGHLSRREGVSYGSQSSAYSGTKSVLSALCAKALLPPARELFPRNPYPRCDRSFKGENPLSEAERERLAQALKLELVDLFNERVAPRAGSDQLAVLVLAICLRVGRNPTPMLELKRHPIEPHPLRSNLRLLRTVKHRACGVQLTPVSLDVVALVDKARELSAPLVERVPAQLRDRLFLYMGRKKGKHAAEVRVLSFNTLRQATRRFIARRNVMGDDGQPLSLNTSRLRKTFENRLWRLSGGDPFAVARLAGHTVRVSVSHYLVPTPEMERNHKFVGEALVAQWGGHTPSSDSTSLHIKSENTPVGRCKDPYHGERAPKNGTACMDFLSCFRCSSYVVVEDEPDLWRLYSFYWFLVRERRRVGASRWAKVYGWIVRMIDDQVTAKFDPSRIRAVRERARNDPHPFWREPLVLEAARGN